MSHKAPSNTLAAQFFDLFIFDGFLSHSPSATQFLPRYHLYWKPHSLHFSSLNIPFYFQLSSLLLKYTHYKSLKSLNLLISPHSSYISPPLYLTPLFSQYKFDGPHHYNDFLGKILNHHFPLPFSHYHLSKLFPQWTQSFVTS